MPNIRRSDPVADASGIPIKPVIATLRVADGTALNDATPFAEILSPLAKAKRSRVGDELFFLFNPAGEGPPDLCRELRDIVRQTYWSASGSVTAALRRSASVANRYLFEHNLNTNRSGRCYGGLACAVLRKRDLFLLQAGPAWACILHEEQLRCFPRGEKLAHMGIGPLADVRLHHAFAALGDTLLLAPYKLLRDAGEEGLHRVLSLGDVSSVAAGLEQLGGNDLAALVARWGPISGTQGTQTQTLPEKRRSEGPSLPAEEAANQRKARDRAEREPQMVVHQVPEQEVRPAKRLPTQQREPLFKETILALGRKLTSGLHNLISALGYVWHGFAAAGAGLLALGKWIAGAIGTTIRSTLPGSERTVHRHTHRHPPPEENRPVTMAIAVAIPIVILAVVLVGYRQFAAESRLQEVINQAKEQIALAQAAEADSEEARTHWEQALKQVEVAATLQPETPSIQALQNQAQEALDRFDRIERLVLTQLSDFGSSNVERRLVLHHRMLFVLDPKDGWAAQVPLDDLALGGTEVEVEADPEQSRQPVLMHTGQQVDGEDIGPLVDATWVDVGEGRQSSALLVLTKNGQLVSHDPSWRSESGAPQLSLLELNSPPLGNPLAVGTYRGRFYVLDVEAEGTGQIWRYKPQGNAYPNSPERYFTDSPPQSLGQAFDMAIDGNIYILYEDGEVEKFLGGEIQAFEIRGIPGGLGEVAGFAVDPDGDGTVYVADRGHDRIVVLSPDGHFQSQFRADPPLTSLEALAVSQADGRLYVLAAGLAYAAVLP